MKSILHPTDFSENAAKALAYAFQMAKRMDAKLVLLHVGDLPTIMNSPSNLSSFAEMEEAHKSEIVDHLKRYTTRYLGTLAPDFPVDHQALLHRSRTKGIIEFAKKLAANLIVIGMKGESQFTEMVLGSTAKELVRKASCPVLIVPPNAVYESIDRVVYASDYDKDDQRVLQSLANMKITKGADTTLLHVVRSKNKIQTEATSRKQEITTQLKNYPLQFVEFEGDNIYDTLRHYIDNKLPDLLVMLEREHHSMIENYFHRDLVKRFAAHSKVPMLSFNQHFLHLADPIR